MTRCALEITLFESSRAHAAADGRTSVTLEDIRTVAPMTLRLRRSTFMEEYFANQESEERELVAVLDAAEEIEEKKP